MKWFLAAGLAVMFVCVVAFWCQIFTNDIYQTSTYTSVKSKDATPIVYTNTALFKFDEICINTRLVEKPYRSLVMPA